MMRIIYFSPKGKLLMNFIFDIGNVLIYFKPREFLRDLFHDPVTEGALYDVIFDSEEWLELDRGTVTPAEACAAFCTRAPTYRENIIEAMNRLPEMLMPIPETVEMLPKIKQAGHSLYYLSNYHKALSAYIQNEYPFFKLFDGGVFSCDIHMVKPSPGIYRFFLEKYTLDPKSCLFFDDVENNIKSAELCGMKGILYKDETSIRDNLSSAK
jgi:putative hydrolase of the HAD superfamily